MTQIPLASAAILIMTQITEDYVSFETSKLLKEKGFNEPTDYYYDLEKEIMVSGNWIRDNFCPNLKKTQYVKDRFIYCPTLQMTMKWIREVHNLYIQIMLDGWACGGHSGYSIVIESTNSDFEEVAPTEKVFYDTHEEACEAAIKYCLENLI